MDLTESSCFLRDEQLMAACRRLWSGAENDGGLVGQLWIEGIFPASSSGKAVGDLAAEGIVSGELVQQLADSGAFPVERPLYAHQSESIMAAAPAAGARPGVVVTAGTGAGKTEAFLLPLLNDLYRNPDPRKRGTKAIILYPMNALVNDQVERLYSWMKGQKKITLFHLTSETPENPRHADEMGYPKYEACRIRTREEARANPPDILVTNYSMLEYMLCRPQDAPFFSRELRTFVLDEAHLYSGTLAADIALLLRRVFLRCGKKAEEVLTLATSATLGEGVKQFAAAIFSKDPETIVHIDGAVDRRDFPELAPASVGAPVTAAALAPLAGRSFTAQTGLVKEPELVDELSRVLEGLVSGAILKSYATIPEPAVFLFKALAHAPLVQKLEELLFASRSHGVISLADLASKLFGDPSASSRSSLIALLQLCARAREDIHSLPLIPHKVHLLSRASGTLSACLNSSCPCGDDLRLPGGGRLVAEVATVCPDCGSRMLTLVRCDNCGEWHFAGIYSSKDNSFTPRSSWRLAAMPANLSYRFAVPARRSETGAEFHFDIVTGRCEETPGAVRLRTVDSCITCREPASSLQPMGTGDGLALPVSVEAVFAEMPVYPEDKRHWLPARGRRLLIFSDSRKEAARLGPLLTDQHELQMMRAVIMETLQSSVSDERSRQRLDRDIGRLLEDLSDPALSDLERGDVHRELEEKIRRREALFSGGSLTDWIHQVKRHQVLMEYFCRPGGVKHRADTWSQKEWEANHAEALKSVDRTLVREFVSPGWNGMTLEALGLAEVVYPNLGGIKPPPELLALLPSFAREPLAAAWPDLLATLCDTIRADGAITVDDGEKDWEWPYFPIGRWMSQSQRFGRGYLLSFRGVEREIREARRNRYCRNVLRAAGCSAEQAAALLDLFLDALFRQLMELAADERVEWLEKAPRQQKDGVVVDAVRVKFFPLALRIPLQLYRCALTGAVFPRAVLGCCILADTPGTLVAISQEELKSDPYYGRAWRMYLQEKAFRMGLWAEEHSAQLDHAETRRLQDLFSTGARNVLSATTTLEVGIDIGGLSGVVLANVPPGRANYQQRGGRAGRRSDGSSLVMTYCRSTAYDQSVFHDFSHFFTKTLRRPTVLLQRDRFAKRHLHAYLLGEFYRRIQPKGLQVGAMQAFGKIGEFCSAAIIPYIEQKGVRRSYEIVKALPYADKLICVHPWWREDARHLADQFVAFLRYLAKEPAEVYTEVATLLEATPGHRWLQSWQETIESVVKDFRSAVDPWIEDYESLLAAWKEESVRDNGEVRALNAMFFQAKALRNSTVIEELGGHRFLPRYGFPIGLQSLTLPAGRGQKEAISLQRDGIVAISEYVPGSSLLVGGRTYTSRGIQKSWAHQESTVGRRGWMYQCTSGHVFHRPLLDLKISGCAVPGCAAPLNGPPLELLIPRFGYSTALWDPPRWKSDPERIGATAFSTTSFAHSTSENKSDPGFGGIPGAFAELCEGGELLAYNSGEYGHGFAICTRCGYSESERNGSGEGRDKLPKHFATHSPLSAQNPSVQCWRGVDGAPILRHQHLAATHGTDLVQIDFAQVPHERLRNTKAVVNTIGHALRLAGADLLESDHRELGMICVPVGPSAYSGLQIFDNAAGGAGHVVELMNDSKAWVARAMEVLYRDEAHHKSCEKGCLRCILTASSQYDWETGNLVRREAYEVLEQLLSGKVMVSSPVVEVAPLAGVPPLESRLARLRKKGT
ncbi:DEAD/DEAH box helicase [Geomonas limicola]|uniref:DEAD/DEAH box helicase n=1 Tax=Geomonas limicola TaxID=2740186 RepID=A0A6V8N4P1_9BACT|nr:DEAD/DEAH box helicase [Geomonas limicola]